MKYLVDPAVDLDYLATKIPAHDVDQMHSVVQYGAASRKPGIHKPRPVTLGQLALIRAVEAVHLPKLTGVEERLYFGEGRAEAHREGGHQLDPGAVAGINHRLRVLQPRRRRLFRDDAPARSP